MAKKKTITLEEVEPAELRGLLRDVPLETAEVFRCVVRFSADHIVRLTYDPETKEVMLEDVPQELTSEILMGENAGWDPNDVAEEKVPVGDLVLETAEKIGKFAFAGRAQLETISAPLCTEIKERAFEYCTGLKSVDFPAVTKIGPYAFDGCTNNDFTYAEFPSLEPLVNTDSRIFNNCSKLVTVDLGNAGVPVQGFNGANALRNIIIRNEAVQALSAWNATTLGGIYSNPTDSKIYVPQDLIASYEVAASWSSAVTAGVSFVAIEGSEYDKSEAE